MDSQPLVFPVTCPECGTEGAIRALPEERLPPGYTCSCGEVLSLGALAAGQLAKEVANRYQHKAQRA